MHAAKKIGLAIGPLPYLSLALSSSLVATAGLTTGMSYASGGAGILDSTVSALLANAIHKKLT
jgi:hypothetical protein